MRGIMTVGRHLDNKRNNKNKRFVRLKGISIYFLL